MNESCTAFSLSAALQAHVGELLHKRSDVRLEDYCQMWESRSGVMLSPNTMSRAIRQTDYTRKKRPWQLTSKNSRSEPLGVLKPHS
jgi:hypothetical protein